MFKYARIDHLGQGVKKGGKKVHMDDFAAN